MSISVKSAILATFFGVTVGALLCYLANKVLALKFILLSLIYSRFFLFSILLVPSCRFALAMELADPLKKIPLWNG